MMDADREQRLGEIREWLGAWKEATHGRNCTDWRYLSQSDADLLVEALDERQSLLCDVEAWRLSNNAALSLKKKAEARIQQLEEALREVRDNAANPDHTRMQISDIAARALGE